MIKCIYCQENKPETFYRKTEHVIPRSFGIFKNNLTLNKVVCDDCNQFFGDNIEIILSRDSYEGLLRFNFNVKEQKNYHTFGKKSRIMIRIAEKPFKGVYAYREYSSKNNDIVLKPLPQVGFKKRDSDEYEYFLLEEIPQKSYLEHNNFDLNNSEAIRAFGIEEKILVQKLTKNGISFKLSGEILPPDDSNNVLCKIESNVDKDIFRAIAKIGFNYITYWQGNNFINQSSFDCIRRFIRYGESTSYPLVRISEKPVLADEPLYGQRRLGHLITVNWANDNVSIVSQVSIFNWVTYSISLAREYSGKRENIKNGHFFNTNSWEILELEVR